MKNNKKCCAACNFPAFIVQWAERTSGSDAGFPLLSDAFQSTSRHGRLVSVKATLAGRYVYLQFKCTTGKEACRGGGGFCILEEHYFGRKTFFFFCSFKKK